MKKIAAWGMKPAIHGFICRFLFLPNVSGQTAGLAAPGDRAGICAPSGEAREICEKVARDHVMAEKEKRETFSFTRVPSPDRGVALAVRSTKDRASRASAGVRRTTRCQVHHLVTRTPAAPGAERGDATLMSSWHGQAFLREIHRGCSTGISHVSSPAFRPSPRGPGTVFLRRMNWRAFPRICGLATWW